MASSMASVNLLLSPSLLLPNSPGTQVSASRLQGAVISSWKVGEKSARHLTCTPTIIRRKASSSPSVLVRNASADHEASETKADLQLGGEDDEGSPTKESALLHRRDIISAATATVSYLSYAKIAHAVATVSPSNMALKDCRLNEIFAPGPADANGVRPKTTLYCCLPDGSNLKAKPFRFEDLPMRTRKPAHILSKDLAYTTKYNAAYRAMKALPDSDPRSFKNQWHIHCAFCSPPGAYPEPGNVNAVNGLKLGLQYHGSWSFLPWHRMYLYFHERILGELINDRSFTLPFWNWDNQRKDDHGNQIPQMFIEDRGFANDELRDALRNFEHFPPAYVNMGGTTQSDDYERIRADNLSVIHTGVVASTSAAGYLGKSYEPGRAEWCKGAGSAETIHNTMHKWTGKNDITKYTNNEDMGVFAFAARDPIFYSHHANVDRLWTVWQGLSPATDEATRRGKRARQNPKDLAFSQTKFAFYDHKGDIVEVKQEDTVNTLKLSYKYQVMESDQDWINFKKRSSRASKPSQETIDSFAQQGTKRIIKNQISSFKLPRRKPTARDCPAGVELGDVEETLLVKGCKLPVNSFTFFKVFINLPDADEYTPLDIQEFSGLIAEFPRGGPANMSMKGELRINCGACFKSLGVADDESVSVTFVPVELKEDVIFDEVAVEFN